MSKQGLKILVPVKRVLDHQIKPLVNKAHTGVDIEGLKFSINPFDDIAIEEALQIKAKLPNDTSTHAVSIGAVKNQDILRNCLAKGIDNVTLIEDDVSSNNQLEPLAVAKVLQKFVNDNNFNCVILGKQAIDDDFNNTGQMLAGLLNWPQATNACNVQIKEDISEVTVTREIDGGEEVVKAKLPIIITTDLRLNTPRYVGLPKLMKVKRKPIPKKTLKSDFSDIDVSPRLETIAVEEPKEKQPGIMLKNVDELVEKLKDAKVI